MTVKLTDFTGGDAYYLSVWVVVVRMKGWSMQLECIQNFHFVY